MKSITKRFTKYTVLIITIFSWAACQKASDSDFVDVAVLNSYLQPGDVFKVQVGRQIPFDSTVSYSADNINNLNITLHHNNNIYTLTSLGNGVYTKSSVKLQQGDNYFVEFAFNGKMVNAASHIPTRPQGFTQSVAQMIIAPSVNLPGVPPSQTTISPLLLSWNNPDGSPYFIVVQNMQPVLVPIVSGTTATAAKAFFTQPTNANFAEIRASDFQYFGNHRLILYHVLPDYATLYQQNSNSSQNLVNPSTSITNGYGIFTGVNADTLYINIRPQ